MIGDVVEMAAALGFSDPLCLDSRALDRGGAARLASWLRRGMPVVTEDDVEVVTADVEVDDAVFCALARLPMPVLEHVVRRVLICGVPGGGGVCAYGPAVPRPDDDQLHVIGVSAGGDLTGVVGHEIAHSWLAPMRTSPPLPARERRHRQRASAFRAVAAERYLPEAAGRVDERLVQPTLRSETAADALASLWLGRSVDGCGPDRESYERARVEAEAAELEEEIR